MQARQRDHGGGQLGSASAELVIATPLLLLCLLLVFQFALWAHARHVALAAAEEGARAARVSTGSAAAGSARAQAFLAALGREVIVAPQVSASRDTDRARVEVRGQAQSVVPGLRLAIDEASEGPVERFRSALEP